MSHLIKHFNFTESNSGSNRLGMTISGVLLSDGTLQMPPNFRASEDCSFFTDETLPINIEVTHY